MADTDVRHILGLSGGKDSAALAVFLYKRIPQMEYFFCDTGKELKETYEYLDRLKARLGIHVEVLTPDRDFDHWLDVYGGMLPSPKARWCTKALKIEPIEKWVGEDEVISYIGIRADEKDRKGYISTKPNIRAEFPFIEAGIKKKDVMRILEDSGIGMPRYYDWRSRSGCFFCFFQRKIEWVRLANEHPNLFREAVDYEQKRGGDGYTWTQGETLEELFARREEIVQEHEQAQARAEAKRQYRLKTFQPEPNRPLADVLTDFLEDEDEEPGCIVCHL
jgi:3'-phosphoadenosine 5'-phosphosulfate sulfotransferase (PAPS reductase)/FAD synthetase